MFLDLILKTIPRSLRAGVALVVMFGAFYVVFQALQQLIIPGKDSFGTLLTFLFGTPIGLAATVVFYYYQHMDEKNVAPKPLETLSKYYEIEQREKRAKEAKATPVFSSHDIPTKQENSKN